jgi:hypothetical protein
VKYSVAGQFQSTNLASSLSHCCQKPCLWGFWHNEG